MKEIVIAEQDAKQRFDKFLKKYFRAATSGFLYKMLRKKNITLNKKKATGNEMLQAGDVIQVFFSDETFLSMQGKDASQDDFDVIKSCSPEISIIYEDDDILVMNKPAGVLSQKAKEDDVSMNEMMLSYLIHSKQLSFDDYCKFHPSIANRLDRNTSGLLLAGKTLKGQQFLAKELNERSCKKIYHTICFGQIADEILLDGYLIKDETNNKVEVLSKERDGAKPIKTKITPLKIGKNYTLLQVHLMTGRTHQIRVHLASIGHSVMGDFKYGIRAQNEAVKKQYGISYQMLHAYSLTLSDGREFIAPEPEIFGKIVKDII